MDFSVLMRSVPKINYNDVFIFLYVRMMQFTVGFSKSLANRQAGCDTWDLRQWPISLTRTDVPHLICNPCPSYKT